MWYDKGMTRKNYERTVTFFYDNKTAYNILYFIYKILPAFLFLAYPALLLYKFFMQEQSLLLLIFIPLGVLILVSVLRIVIDEKRPYEVYGMDSVFHKKTKGKSMPSRHTACAFIIAMALLSLNVPVGIFALAIATLITASRVLAGAHFIRDVLAAIAISVLSGILIIAF